MERSDMSKCVLCYDAPCSRECPNIRPSDVLRSIWFYNEKWAAANLPYDTMCMSCHALCEKKCIKSGEVPIRDLITRLFLEVRPALAITAPDDSLVGDAHFVKTLSDWVSPADHLNHSLGHLADTPPS